MKNTMINRSNINRTRLCLLICLESIKIENHNYLLDNNGKKFKNSINITSYNKFKKTSKLSSIKNLSLIKNILNNTKKKYEKNKIIYILKYYSNIDISANSKLNTLFSKFIERFSYKYIKYYKYNLRNKQYKKIHDMNNISLINLYLLYKILNTNKKFYTYKHLKL